MTVRLISWSILDRNFIQIGATDRLDHAMTQRRLGYSLMQYESDVEVDEITGEFARVVNRQTIYLPAMGEKR